MLPTFGKFELTNSVRLVPRAVTVSPHILTYLFTRNCVLCQMADSMRRRCCENTAAGHGISAASSAAGATSTQQVPSRSPAKTTGIWIAQHSGVLSWSSKLQFSDRRDYGCPKFNFPLDFSKCFSPKVRIFGRKFSDSTNLKEGSDPCRDAIGLHAWGHDCADIWWSVQEVNDNK